MSIALALPRPRGVLRHSPWDALLVTLALGQGVLLFALPVLPVVAFGLWWNSNTVSHYFIHKPFFRPRWLNNLFAGYLTLLLGIPQSLWRDRHLAHHAGREWRFRLTSELAVEFTLVLGLWITLLVMAPGVFLLAYLPGFIIGLGLCWLHGYYEHIHGTVSHHGRLYNFLFFNDGYHVEHHAAVSTHWRVLPNSPDPDVAVSRWPAVLRWLEIFSLENLERIVLRSRMLQWFVIATHSRAFRKLLMHIESPNRIAIVGGGLFPRTALILRQLRPESRLTIIDSDEANLQTAQTFPLGDTEIVNERYDPERHNDFDVVVIPLAYVGDRERLYREPTPPFLLVHDWLWRRTSRSAIVSWLLLKRLNLVKQ